MPGDYEYDSNYASWLTGAGITVEKDPVSIRTVMKQTLANLNAVGTGGILARLQYAPASAQTYNLVAAGTGLTAIDTTNLAITFKAPTSGNVMVRLTAFSQGGAAAGTSIVFGLTSTTSSPGTVVGVTELANLTPTATAADNGEIGVTTQIITGLTAGTSYTWYFAAMYSGTASKIVAHGSTSATTVPTGAPAVMEVWAA